MDKDLVMAIEKLKEVRRKGWVDSGIKDAESVADHTCGVALCVLFAALERKDIDVKKALTMALIHDLAESIVGDITPHDGITRKEKLAKEEKAMKLLLSSLPKKVRIEIFDMWKEFEKGSSPEAMLVREADLFERVMQANIYRKHGENVLEFLNEDKQLKDKPLKTLLEKILM